MKKIKNFAYVSAMALLSMTAFSACSSSDDLAEGTPPNPSAEGSDVNVNFVFNVSTSNEPTNAPSDSRTMRMSSANTQASVAEAFRGINNAYLLSLNNANGDGKYVTTTTVGTDLISLGTVIGANKLNPNATETSGDVAKSHRVLQLSLQSGTNNLMFWGKAIKDGTDAEQGKITMDIKQNLADTKISMCKVVPDEAYEPGSIVYKAVLAQYQTLMAAALTTIINSGVTSEEVTFGKDTKTVTINWKDYATVSGEAGSYKLSKPTKDPSDNTKDLSLLSDRLASTFVSLNTINTSELRAGYGLAISDMMFDLMGSINQVVNATPLNMEEAVAQAVATAIKTNVENFFDKNHDYNWLSPAVVKAAATTVLDNQKNLIPEDAKNYNLNDFPKFFNLPNGSVILQLAIEKAGDSYKYTYGYQGSVETYAMGGGANDSFKPENYMYPAELCYFGNAPTRVTEETLVAGDYPDGVADWDNPSSWTSKKWNLGHVTTSTRSVAMKDNINYGTAMLKSTVRYGAQVLQDNNHNLQAQWSNNTVDEPNNTISVNERDDHFELTGILVGGQDPEVGWNYIAKGSKTGFGAMVYDNVGSIKIPAATAATGGNASQEIYTLLWDNWDAKLKGNKQRDVYVALEFKNNSKNFFGLNNLIRNGATFYIVGKLDPDKIKKNSTEYYTAAEAAADRSLGITWPTNYALPPYETTGENAGKTIKERRVFMQDFVTSATFVIGETSLQKALVAVPDLRAGQISLGLSVDLNWQTGLTYDSVILGDQ